MAANHRDLAPDWLNARVLPLLPRGVDAGRLQVLGLRSVADVWRICDAVWGADIVRDEVVDLVSADLAARGLRP
jgi:hypothetical protein